MSEDWITTNEAAEISGFHTEYVRRLVRNEQIRARKFGVIWQVDRKSLHDYIKEGKKTGDRRYGAK